MKRFIMLAALLFISTVSVLFYVNAQELPLAEDLPKKTWKRGLEIAPVQLNLEGKNRKMVGEGSYLVNAVAGCLDCHTAPTYLEGGDPFLGQAEKINTTNYMAGGAKFGPFTSANLTPDSKGLPAGLTFDQFKESVRTGKDFKNRHPQFGPILQVFPWPAYSKMTDDDIRNIYEYLRAIPHAEPAPPAAD